MRIGGMMRFVRTHGVLPPKSGLKTIALTLTALKFSEKCSLTFSKLRVLGKFCLVRVSLMTFLYTLSLGRHSLLARFSPPGF